MTPRPAVLTLSSLFPNRAEPARGIFVERQVVHMLPYCDPVVVCPVRVFPPLRVWRYGLQPRRFSAEWRAWSATVYGFPAQDTITHLPVYYARYTSPPRQGFQGQWGFYAYPFLRQLLQRLHQQYRFDLIHAHYASPNGVIALLAARWMQVPVVLSIHGADVAYTVNENWLSNRIIKWVFSNAHVILANSQRTYEKIVAHGGRPELTRIVRLGGDGPHDLPQSPESDGTVRSHSGRMLRLLTVARLIPQKGHAYVLRAMHQLVAEGHDLCYTIVGDGPGRAHLEALADELRLSDRVTFAGSQPHDNVWAFYQSCDIFVMPSWDEAFGVVYIEAMWCGKPVIAAETSGAATELTPLDDCIELVRERDVPSLVATLRTLIEHPHRREQLGRTGYEVVTRHFTWQQTARDTWDVYQRALNGSEMVV